MRTPAAFAAVLALGAATVLPAAGSSIVPVPAAAAASLTWGVAPSGRTGPDGRPAFEYKLNPGATLTDYVAVTNHSERPITLDVYASDAFTTEQGGFDLLAASREPIDVGAWVTFRTRTLTVPSTSRLTVPFTLAVPRNATPGDHPGGIVASLAATGTDDKGNQVAVDHRVGARMYLRVTGELQPALDVEDLTVIHDGSWHPLSGGTVTADLTVRNTGNVRLTGQPELTVSGPFGLARRVRAGELPEILPGGRYRTRVRIDGIPPVFRLQATLAVEPAAVTGEVLDPAPATVTRQVGLWALPWPQLVILLLAGAALWLAVRHRRRRQRRAAQELERAVASARAQGRAEAAARTPDRAGSPDLGTDSHDTTDDTEGAAR